MFGEWTFHLIVLPLTQCELHMVYIRLWVRKLSIIKQHMYNILTRWNSCQQVGLKLVATYNVAIQICKTTLQLLLHFFFYSINCWTQVFFQISDSDMEEYWRYVKLNPQIRYFFLYTEDCMDNWQICLFNLRNSRASSIWSFIINTAAVWRAVSVNQSRSCPGIKYCF